LNGREKGKEGRGRNGGEGYFGLGHMVSRNRIPAMRIKRIESPLLCKIFKKSPSILGTISKICCCWLLKKEHKRINAQKRRNARRTNSTKITRRKTKKKKKKKKRIKRKVLQSVNLIKKHSCHTSKFPGVAPQKSRKITKTRKASSPMAIKKFTRKHANYFF
jgi:hypothetical protein